MGKKRSQASVEYLIIVGVSVGLIVAGSYFFFVQRDYSDSEILKAKAEALASQLIMYSEEAHYSTGAYRKIIETDLDMLDFRVVDRGYSMRIQTIDGAVHSFLTNTPVYSQISLDLLNSGQMVVERVRSTAVICSVVPCTCGDNETGAENCTDSMDNDCDGFIDEADATSCCFDHDEDGYTGRDIEGGIRPWCANAPDCDDDDNLTHPGAIEQCDALDHNCDSNPFNDACVLQCFVEGIANENGRGICAAGNTILLSLSANDTNAHVKVPGQYDFDLCCDDMSATGADLQCLIRYDSQCYGGEGKVLGFNASDPIGSHVEGPSGTTLPDSLCCKVASSAGMFNCTERYSSSACNANEIGVASFSDLAPGSPEFTTFPAHIASYPYYHNKICCGINTGVGLPVCRFEDFANGIVTQIDYCSIG